MKVSQNISIKEFNSFGVDVRAARLVEWEAAEELPHIFGEMIAGGKHDEIISNGKRDEAITKSKRDEANEKSKWMALGGGNNILFTRDYDGTLIRSLAKKIEITGSDAEKVRVRAEAGVDWDEFTAWCVEHELWGAENLSGIPGTVGACPIQNIGAYGAEAKDIIRSVECFCIDRHAENENTETECAETYRNADTDRHSQIEDNADADRRIRTETGANKAPAGGKMLTLAVEHCEFGYRDSIFKRTLRGRVIVTAVNFALWRTPHPNLHYSALAEKVAEQSGQTGHTGQTPHPDDASLLRAIRRAVIGIRDSKLPDPHETGNAGSFFKNPIVDTEAAQTMAAKYPTMPLYPCADRPGKSKLAAGWLIEQAGWKGRIEGRVGIHPGQALIVINTGGATGREIVDFARRVQDDVKAKFGIELSPEVNIC